MLRQIWTSSNSLICQERLLGLVLYRVTAAFIKRVLFGPGGFRGCEAGHCFHLLYSKTSPTSPKFQDTFTIFITCLVWSQIISPSHVILEAEPLSTYLCLSACMPVRPKFLKLTFDPLLCVQ